MKNKLFISILCLAIFQTASFATCPLKKQNDKKPVQCKNIQRPQMIPTHLGKQFETYRKIERTKMYDALNLTLEQRDKAIELDAIAFDKCKAAARKLGKAQLKLDFLKANNACHAKIALQEHAVRRAKTNCHKQLIKARNNFGKILNDTQREKYEKILQIKREERIKHFVEYQQKFKHFEQLPHAQYPPVPPMFDTEGRIIHPQK